jgi:hypothetical protein
VFFQHDRAWLLETKMSAFTAYGGAYEYGGRPFIWRCYATARVVEVRAREHIPQAAPPRGLKWVRRGGRKGDKQFAWLVDAPTGDFSHILLCVEPARWSAEPVVGQLQAAAI